MVGQQEGHLACKKSCSTIPKRFSSGIDGERPEGEPADPGSCGKSGQ